MLVVGLVLPLSIGLVIKRCSPRVALVMKRLLKPISIIFILFMMTFGVYANLFIFAFFSWKVAFLIYFCFLHFFNENIIFIETWMIKKYSGFLDIILYITWWNNLHTFIIMSIYLYIFTVFRLLLLAFCFLGLASCLVLWHPSCAGAAGRKPLQSVLRLVCRIQACP